MKKIRLDPEALAVESFAAGDGRAPQRGTVEANAGCTYFGSCLCPSAYYYCGDGYQTIYSCDYSRVDPCPTSIYNC